MDNRERVINNLIILRTWTVVNPKYGLGLDMDDCRKAAQWLDDALELLETQHNSADDWINVKDHPPEKDKDVIIYGYYVGPSGKTYPTTIISDIEEFKAFKCVPIAWMPLPEPPKEEKPECD